MKSKHTSFGSLAAMWLGVVFILVQTQKLIEVVLYFPLLFFYFDASWYRTQNAFFTKQNEIFSIVCACSIINDYDIFPVTFSNECVVPGQIWHVDMRPVSSCEVGNLQVPSWPGASYCEAGPGQARRQYSGQLSLGQCQCQPGQHWACSG